MLRKVGNIVLVQVLLSCLMPMATWAQNLLSNPGFEKPAAGVSPGTPVSYTGFCRGGTTAAAVWQVWVNTCPSDISTTLVPSTAPGGGKYMIHVVTNGVDNGIWYCCFASQASTTSSIWVYVNSGCVGMGTGTGAFTGDTDEMTCLTGKWIQFKAPNSQNPAFEFVVYSKAIESGGVTNTGADFYVDLAKVVVAP